ncbi:MAG TPA: glycosyltransferase [Alphaproteobacteria bacterium]
MNIASRPKTGSETAPADRLPLVSVVITNHNYARYLRACFDSVQKQAYPRVECVIVDDNSSDDSHAVLDQIERSAPRFATTVLRGAENAGQYGAMRKGFAASKGQFVAFLDADDLLDEDFAAANVACHLSSKIYAAMSTSDQWIIDAEGNRLGVNPRRQYFPFMALPRRLLTAHEIESRPFALRFGVELIAADANWPGYWIWGTTSSMMFRRDVLALIMARDIEMRISADDFLANFAHAIGGTAVIDRVLGSYRRHGANNFADNLVLGGFAPLLRDKRTAEHTPRSHIGACLEEDAAKFREVLGERLFAVVAMRFCGIRRGFRILRAHRVRRDYILGQFWRNVFMRVAQWAQGYRRDFCWITFRRPTYW